MPKDAQNQNPSERKIESLTKLATKNFSRFAIAAQHMSAEAQIKLIQQLPEFRKLATDAVTSIERSYQATLKSNDESAQAVHSGYAALIGVLIKRLDKENLTLEDERWILNKIAEAVAEQKRMHNEDRNAKVAMFGKVVAGTAAVAVAVVVAVAGGKAALDQGNSDQA